MDRARYLTQIPLAFRKIIWSFKVKSPVIKKFQFVSGNCRDKYLLTVLLSSVLKIKNVFVLICLYLLKKKV